MKIVLDLETTGFSPETHEIIEFGAVLIGLDYIPIASFQTLIRPNILPEQKVQNITGIDAKRLTYAPTIIQMAPMINQFIGMYPCVGHNIIKFDSKFLHKHGIMKGNQLIDTLEISRSRGATDKHGLDFLCQHYNIKRKRSHRALDDAKATAQLYKILS